MRTYIATHNGYRRCGGFVDCVLWARERVGRGKSVALILLARPGAKTARIIAEIAADQERMIHGGRIALLAKVRP